ncbi:ABC-type oligopeptide transporter ABCB9 [Bombina bombina]|uniref:ABC-type oligopeptide transporter ABCB9 n=1 Tax=Bombina bombina TaxID=8345 RepID=UPI00235AC553|nr:ABC-type oligopeptide transporter ABCB9 [Bombina bombina]
MSSHNVMFYSLIFTVSDLTVTTLLYLHSCKKQSVLEDVMHFDIFHSLLDIWGMSLLRSCILLWAMKGVQINHIQGSSRLKSSVATMMLLCYLIVIYTMIKLLLFCEEEKLQLDPWFWSLMGWTWVSSAVTLSLWRELGHVDQDGPGVYCKLSAKQEVDQENKTEQEAQSKLSSGATIGKILSYCKADAGYLTLASVFLLLCSLGESFSPYYSGQVIDGIIGKKSLKQFSSAIVTLSAIAVMTAFSAGVRSGLFTFISSRLNIRICNNLFRSLMVQEIGFFDENHTGDIISRLTSDTEVLSGVISENVPYFLQILVKAVCSTAIMFSLSWRLSLVAFMGFPVILLVSRVYGTYYKKLSKEVQSAIAKANSTAEETISAIKTVRSFANEETEASVYAEKLEQVQSLHKKEAFANIYYIWSNEITQLVLQISTLYYGGYLVVTGQMDSGHLISFIIYEVLLGECVQSFGHMYGGLMKGIGTAEKVFELIDRKPKMVNNGTLAPEHVEGKVEFRNVTFAYPTRPSENVLKNLSLTLVPGKVTALVGPSGSGKTSCANILLNFYPVQEGEVLLDGQPISMYDYKYLHNKISIVSQEPVLFTGSIQNNISYGLNSVPLELIVSAAEKANAHTFITELQGGYNTETGEKGTQLSGGQKQRVAIARSLIRNPTVLILDEATSALDAETEHVIQLAMTSNLENHTVLIIAHRLSTVEKSHNIIVLDKGNVVQQGSHTALMEEGGLYAQLVQHQISGAKPASEEINHSRPEKEVNNYSAMDECSISNSDGQL